MAIVSFGTYEVVRAALLALEDSAGAVVAENEYAQVWDRHTHTHTHK